MEIADETNPASATSKRRRRLTATGVCGKYDGWERDEVIRTGKSEEK